MKRAAPKNGPLMTVQDDVNEIKNDFFKGNFTSLSFQFNRI